MALFDDKKHNDLSHWAKIRDTDDDNFTVIARTWATLKDRWEEGFEGKISIICMTAFVAMLMIGVVVLLQSYIPTFDPSL